jgi:predicted GH43/DUF377 family glycosyl hydrolase
MDIVAVKAVLKDDNVSFFNAAAWPKKGTKNIILIGRELSQKGAFGEPDIGRIVLYEIDSGDEIVRKRVVWEPVYESLYLEDPRALVYKDGRVVIGLTAVLRTKNGIQTFPALTSADNGMTSSLSPITLIQAFGLGKNTTPLLENYFLFRPEGENFNHRFLVFYYKDFLLKEVGLLSLPKDLSWASWRMGTGCPPIWLDKYKAIFIIHGISVKNGKYVYSIGVSLLEKRGEEFSLRVYPQPILTQETLKQKIKIRELRPSLRRVVYVCGGVVKNAEPSLLHLYVNVGDCSTYDVTFRLKDLKRLFDL